MSDAPKHLSFIIPGVYQGVQSLVVHVPQDSNGFLSFSFANKDCGFSFHDGLSSGLDLE